MMFEVLGFAAGVAAIGIAWRALLRHERYLLIRGIYGPPSASRRRKCLDLAQPLT